MGTSLIPTRRGGGTELDACGGTFLAAATFALHRSSCSKLPFIGVRFHRRATSINSLHPPVMGQ